MHLLKIQEGTYAGQADPFILKSGGRYYIYVTGHDGIYAYHSDRLLEGWEYHGKVLEVPGLRAFWAPSVIALILPDLLFFGPRIPVVMTAVCMFLWPIRLWAPLLW